MTDSHAAPSVGRFEIRATSDSHFSWIRTRLSLERTMMSWLRTATALIGFGFAIVQFFERLQQTPEVRSAYLPNAPIYLGLALIACGVSDQCLLCLARSDVNLFRNGDGIVNLYAEGQWLRSNSLKSGSSKGAGPKRW